MLTFVKRKISDQFFFEAKTLIHLAVPIIISQVAQMGMNFTDTVMAGRHSEISLAGVAIGSSLWVPSFLLLVGIMMAITPLIAHAWGREDIDEIRHTFQQGIWVAALCGIAVMLLLQLLSLLFQFVDMESQTREQARGYAVAVSYGFPALAFFQVFRGLNDGVHLTRPFMYVSLIAVILNIPLNYIFIYGKLGLPEMGGVGSGWATCVVLWLEFIAIALITQRGSLTRSFKLSQAWQAPQRDSVIKIMKLGIPIGLSIMVEATMFSLIALILAPLGSTVVAGHQVAMSFISTLFMFPLSLSMALTIRCGYYLGQENPASARFVGKMGLLFAFLLACLFSLVILSASSSIAAIYIDSIAVQSLAVQLLFFAVFFQFSDGLQVTAAGILRGYKDTRFAFFTVIFSYWVVGLPLGYALGMGSLWGGPYGAQGFWVSFIVSLTIVAGLLSHRFLKISKAWVQSPD